MFTKEEHSLPRCNLVRTIERGLNSFTKQSANIHLQGKFAIEKRFDKLFEEKIEGAILEQDAIKDKTTCDVWMWNYYQNFKNDVFNEKENAVKMIVWYNRALNQDLTWTEKKSNLDFIENYNGMVTRKVAKELAYTLKKHHNVQIELKYKNNVNVCFS